jgi:peptidyl-tRNA hydrolase
VQYLVLRGDLKKKWGLGALVAQGAHASTAAIWLHRELPATAQYLQALDSMHKVVLEAPDEAALQALAAALAAAGVPHKLWLEQPEMTASCLASAPGRRSALREHFSALKLMR